jgi:hypothetical protein
VSRKVVRNSCGSEACNPAPERMTGWGQIRPSQGALPRRLRATGVPQEADPIADKAGDPLLSRRVSMRNRLQRPAPIMRLRLCDALSVG